MKAPAAPARRRSTREVSRSRAARKLFRFEWP